MSNSLENNLFNYATSELSQDAFICYLCSFALKSGEEKDRALAECAKELIKRFSGNHFKSMDFTLNGIKKQFKHIDVLLSLTYDGREYEIIIEDKIFTDEHDDQLKRYIKDREEETKNQGTVIGAYYKTGFQGDLQPVMDADYTIIGRKEILDTLERYLECSSNPNRIIQEYYDYWGKYDELAKEYIKLNIADWDIKHILGCYSALQEELKKERIKTGYSYVANPRGGEWVLYLQGIQASKLPVLKVGGCRFGVYLQITMKYLDNDDGIPGTAKANIYLKLTHVDIEDKTGKPEKYTKQDKRTDLQKASDARNMIISSNNRYRFSDFIFERPNRIYPGVSMTIGVYDKTFNTYGDLSNGFHQAYEQYEHIVNALCKEFEYEVGNTLPEKSQ